MQIVRSKVKFNKYIVAIIMVILFLLMGTEKVFALEDPAVGTASTEIENMIAHGKSIIGKTNYVWGGGHGNWSSQKDKAIPDGLDCSSFISWAMYRGMGVSMDNQAPPTGTMKKYYNSVGKGSYDIAKRGDLIWTPGHVEIYLGKDDAGQHISLHAQNPRKHIGITKANWGASPKSSTEILRLNMDDAKLGKKGLNYDASKVIDVGVEGVEQGNNSESSANMAKGEFDQEKLFEWLDPIVDFKGTSDTHSKSEPGESLTDSKNKGLKDNKEGIFSKIFGK